MVMMEPNVLRETLTLAAKVAGMKVRGYDYGHTMRQPAVLVDTGGRSPQRWNSVMNDGDALRLFCDSGALAHRFDSDVERLLAHGWAGAQFPAGTSLRVLVRLAITLRAADRARERGMVA